MIAAPQFSFWTVFFIALGAMVYWNKEGRHGVRAYLLTELTDLIPWEKIRSLVDFFVFIGLGCVVALFFVKPSNPPQAFAAGLGWTGLLTSPDRNRDRTK